MRTILKACGLSLVALSACAPVEEMEVDDPVDAELSAAIETSLGDFEANPQAFLDRLPGKTGTADVALFSSETIASRGFLAAKDSTRNDPDPKADAWGANDWAKNLVDTYAVTRLNEMSSLKRANLAESPWSDDYWALYAGSIAKRYADPAMPGGTDWKALTDYVRTKSPASLDNLSPAEKYDMLVGDAAKSLTASNLNTGKPYYDANGKVETWMGICHGWSPAAFMVPRPQKVVQVLAADGTTKINFYPSDIKALASTLWANARATTRFIGGRCNVKDPKKDSIGRIVDTACRDTNAGTWHLAVVNQIGKSKRSMVLDATFDYEVWNQPVYAYDYVYFNPKTNKTSSTLTGAKVTMSSFTNDKFKQYRAPGTTHVVGVAMNVKWVVETYPSHAATNSPSQDAISGARYLYTLELDQDGNITGGEWLQNAHPDFLWAPAKDAQVRSLYEATAVGTWDGKTAVPATWRTAAVKSAASGQPLAGIVNKLAELARQ